MRWNSGNQFPIISPGYGYLAWVISSAKAKWGNQKTQIVSGTLRLTSRINSRLFLLGMDTYPGSSLAPQRSEGIRKKKTHIVSRTLRLTSRINSRLFAHGLSFAMHTWERRTKAACPFPNQTRLLNKIELVYVYAYTDGEPPSQLTVSFGLLGGSYPLTIRSQSDHSPIYSPITVRSYVLLPFHITRLKRIYRFERGSFFSCENLKLLVNYMIGLWSDCNLTVDRTMIGL